MDNRPIGVFDSGIGGLTVLKELIREMPHENFIYLGDTARVPYGTRGSKIITTFALQLTNFLLQKNVKFLVVACNTITATCLDKIEEISPVPVLGVIKPAARTIVKTTKNGKVGILGTRATIESGIYEKEIQKLDGNIDIFSLACPLFVPIAEEGLGESNIADLAAEHYLKELKGIDTLHLGCTHYPLLINAIRKTVGSEVTIIDSAKPTAVELINILKAGNILNDHSGDSTVNFYFTDVTERSKNIAELFLGKKIENDICTVLL